MRLASAVLAVGWTLLVGLGVSMIYVRLSSRVTAAVVAAASLAIVLGTAAYLIWRPAARRLVWPRATVHPREEHPPR